MHLNSLFAREKALPIPFCFKNTSQVHPLMRGHPAVTPCPVLLHLTFPWAPCNLQGCPPWPAFASGPRQLWGGGGAGTHRSAVCLYPNLRHVLCVLFFVQPCSGAETPARRLRRGTLCVCACPPEKGGSAWSRGPEEQKVAVPPLSPTPRPM